MRRLAAFSAPLNRGVMRWLLAASCAAFLAMALLPHGDGVRAHAHSGPHASAVGAPHPGAVLITISRMTFDWSMMILAMMLPLVSMPISHLRAVTHPRARWGATAAFLVGYVGQWIAAGAILLPLAAFIGSLSEGFAAGVAALALASIWSTTPWAQWGRNRCHRLVRVGGLPPAVYRDALRQGLLTGSGCLVACWPWMVAPMVLKEFHLPAMVTVTAYLLLERTAPPARPGWRWPPAIDPWRRLPPRIPAI